MPDWLYRLLEDEEKYNLEHAPSGISDILLKPLEQDREIETVHLCHSAVGYVGKVKVGGKDEGNDFCGYHNIQMLVSYVNAAEAPGFEKFAGGIPSIWEIQGMIEEAWDQGFNHSGRVQTGGIRGTRKHIGTPEAQALFSSLKIPCKADRFEDLKDGAKAYEQLLDSVEHYFSASLTTTQLPKIHNTGLPPIYLQRPRHSMTVVGIEKRKDGSRSLLVFDPAYNPSKEMLRMLNPASATNVTEPSMSLIKPYRRGEKYLKRFRAFETLRLVAPV
ncbi:MAG: hypothetical protein ASARMPRED_002982 [Alectoria sarmentosa]|nr:MAG: hypothetical protein ASARMPRED_002982 [Alectoria sarmentosa]